MGNYRIQVESNGEDVTERLMAGETIYFVPGESALHSKEPENGELPDFWQPLGMTHED